MLAYGARLTAVVEGNRCVACGGSGHQFSACHGVLLAFRNHLRGRHKLQAVCHRLCTQVVWGPQRVSAYEARQGAGAPEGGPRGEEIDGM